MNILEMPSQISTLSEGFLTKRAFERSESRMLPEVVPQIAALLKHTPALRIPAFKVELDSLSLWILNSNSLVPLLRNSFKGLMFISS